VERASEASLRGAATRALLQPKQPPDQTRPVRVLLRSAVEGGDPAGFWGRDGLESASLRCLLAPARSIARGKVS
jgi:hypothetical protein